MFEIIPAINATDWGTVKKQIEQIAPSADWVHVDVADGTFTKNITWNNPADIKQLKAHVRIEAHLMVENPEVLVPGWIKAGVRRVIVHWETIKARGFFGAAQEKEKKVKAMVEMCHANWVEFAVSILFRTPTDQLKTILPLLDMVQVLAVEPGVAGQEFNHQALVHVEYLRKYAPQLKIEVDGGVKPSNISEIFSSGANVVTAASAIFGSSEPERALELLKRHMLG